jgi:membrane protease YdiL (CAAX protease family)
MQLADIVDTGIKKDRVVTYSAAVLVAGYLWQAVIYFKGGVDSPLIPVLMLIPGLLAIALMKKDGDDLRSIGWRPRSIKHTLLAIFYPLVSMLAFVYVLHALGWASLTIFTTQNGLIVSKAPLILGNHPQSLPFFAVNLSITFLPITVLGGFFALGEEVGWRGYLQDRMVKRFGIRRGLVLLGLLWGYWHLPLVLMGWGFDSHRVLGGLVLFPVSTVFFAIIMGYLYLRTNSIWIPVWFHAAANSASSIVFSGMTFSQSELTIKILWIASWGIAAAICMRSLESRPDSTIHLNSYPRDV